MFHGEHEDRHLIDRVAVFVYDGSMTINEERQAAAAKELEEISIIFKEFVLQLRSGVGDDLAYAMVYYARHRLGQTVAKMGVGVPQSTLRQKVVEIAESQLWNER